LNRVRRRSRGKGLKKDYGSRRSGALGVVGAGHGEPAEGQKVLEEGGICENREGKRNARRWEREWEEGVVLEAAAGKGIIAYRKGQMRHATLIQDQNLGQLRVLKLKVQGREAKSFPVGGVKNLNIKEKEEDGKNSLAWRWEVLWQRERFAGGGGGGRLCKARRESNMNTMNSGELRSPDRQNGPV